MKIGMIVAMEKELKQLRPLFSEDKVILQKSGIATVNAAIQAVEMIRQYKPDCIISSGCAGGNGDDIKLTGAKPGLIVTGDWFVDSKEKMREIVGHFPDAKAVDMESCAIAQVCYIYKVPFISFRLISDIPLRDTDASQYHNFWDSVAEKSFQTTKTFIESL